ncbi:hypothetical protein BGZ63DRAFT_395376 [Mariannaea sp. PMI_226]|nr:hypothetical protein BGZ63DRAFT_395376 [Mariannaea sp. PMI_226]
MSFLAPCFIESKLLHRFLAVALPSGVVHGGYYTWCRKSGLEIRTMFLRRLPACGKLVYRPRSRYIFSIRTLSVVVSSQRYPTLVL